MFSVCEYAPILENLGLLCVYMCVSCVLVNLWMCKYEEYAVDLSD